MCVDLRDINYANSIASRESSPIARSVMVLDLV